MQLRTTARHRPRPLMSPWQHTEDHWTFALWLLAGGIVIWGLISFIGLALAHVADRGAMNKADLGVNLWFAQHRSSFWNAATAIGTTLAGTTTVVAITAVVVLILRWRTQRWFEAIVLVIAVVGEVLIFLAVTASVPERRPHVSRLDPAPMTSSYPSGHTGAAVCLYGGIAILLLWLYGARPGVKLAAAALWCVPVAVGLSRVYRGMHYPSDVLAGTLLGGLWLSFVLSTFLPRRPWARRSVRQPPERPATRRLRS